MEEQQQSILPLLVEEFEQYAHDYPVFAEDRVNMLRSNQRYYARKVRKSLKTLEKDAIMFHFILMELRVMEGINTLTLFSAEERVEHLRIPLARQAKWLDNWMLDIHQMLEKKRILREVNDELAGFRLP